MNTEDLESYTSPTSLGRTITVAMYPATGKLMLFFSLLKFVSVAKYVAPNGRHPRNKEHRSLIFWMSVIRWIVIWHFSKCMALSCGAVALILRSRNYWPEFCSMLKWKSQANLGQIIWINLKHTIHNDKWEAPYLTL